MRKILRVVGLLTVKIFCQTKKFKACEVKDEKEDTIFKQIFQISHDCYTENVYHRQDFGKIYVEKLLEIPFFQIRGLRKILRCLFLN